MLRVLGWGTFEETQGENPRVLGDEQEGSIRVQPQGVVDVLAEGISRIKTPQSRNRFAAQLGLE